MRKRIAIFGGSLFQDIKLEGKQYKVTHKMTTIKLSKNYDIENYSMENLSAQRVLKLIRSIPIKELYNDCILALGEADLDNSIQFESTLLQIVEELQSNNVRPLLVSLPKELLEKEEACAVQDAIDRIAIEKNIDYIYEGKTSKVVSYVVLDDEDLHDAILALC